MAQWLNGWVFVYELSGCGFESSCCHYVPTCYMHITSVISAQQSANQIEYIENELRIAKFAWITQVSHIYSDRGSRYNR